MIYHMEELEHGTYIYTSITNTEHIYNSSYK